jgi:hypothetical protein
VRIPAPGRPKAAAAVAGAALDAVLLADPSATARAAIWSAADEYKARASRPWWLMPLLLLLLLLRQGWTHVRLDSLQVRLPDAGSIDTFEPVHRETRPPQLETTACIDASKHSSMSAADSMSGASICAATASEDKRTLLVRTRGTPTLPSTTSVNRRLYRACCCRSCFSATRGVEGYHSSVVNYN